MSNGEDEHLDKSPERDRRSRSSSRSTFHEVKKSRKESRRSKRSRSRSRTRSPRRRSRSRSHDRRDRGNDRDRDYSNAEGSNRLHITGIDESIRRSDIEDNFGKYGRIVDLWLATYAPFYAFITYESAGDARDAIDALNRTNLRGCKIGVSVALPRRRDRWSDRPSYSSSSSRYERRRSAYGFPWSLARVGARKAVHVLAQNGWMVLCVVETGNNESTRGSERSGLWWTTMSGGGEWWMWMELEERGHAGVSGMW